MGLLSWLAYFSLFFSTQFLRIILLIHPELMRPWTVTTSPLWSVSSRTKIPQHSLECVAGSVFSFAIFKFSTVLVSGFCSHFAEGGIYIHFFFFVNFFSFFLLECLCSLEESESSLEKLNKSEEWLRKSTARSNRSPILDFCFLLLAPFISVVSSLRP